MEGVELVIVGGCGVSDSGGCGVSDSGRVWS